MINLYAYTYPAAAGLYQDQGYILIKVGDSHRDVDIRMAEQGGAAEFQSKVTVGRWNGLKNIERDFKVHEVLRIRGLHHRDGNGTEWFKIPANTLAVAFEYLDKVISELEGHVVRDSVSLRDQQSQSLDQAMDIIERAVEGGKDSASLIANLCPRFGKTIWALILFNRISDKYGNRVMLLPAYWLSSHTSFAQEINKYSDFLDIQAIDTDDDLAYLDVGTCMAEGKRVVIPISLHGDLEEWKIKHHWISTIPNEEIFNFADEGDFGTHTENQADKLKFLFNQD